MKSPLPFLFVVALTTVGCELFTVGGGATYAPEVERSQRSSAGVVHLWKAELDSGNFTAMTELMRHKDGRPLLALERHDLADDTQRWKKIIGGKPITETKVDTLSATSHTVHVKVDYIRSVTFGTIEQSGRWWVTRVE